MWLYPLPALLATFGFLFVLIERKNFLKEVRYAVVIVIAGVAIYLVRSWRRGEWPFGGRGASPDAAASSRAAHPGLSRP
jgi:hypothetical protein